MYSIHNFWSLKNWSTLIDSIFVKESLGSARVTYRRDVESGISLVCVVSLCDIFDYL